MHSKDDLHLEDFVHDTIVFFTKWLRVFIKFVATEKRKAVFILAAGLLLISIVYINKKSFYHASITFTYNCLHKKVFGEEIHKLENLCKSKDYETLSQKLNIPVQQARSLQNIYAVNIGNSPLYEDITEEKLPFYVHYEFTDPKDHDLLQKSIINFLNNLPQGKTRMQEIVDSNNRKASFYKRQIGLLDSIKVEMASGNSDAYVIGNANTPLKDAFELSEKYEYELIQLDLLSANTEVVNVFSTENVTFNDKRNWLFANGLVYYFLFSLGSILMLFWYKKFYESKKNNFV